MRDYKQAIEKEKNKAYAKLKLPQFVDVLHEMITIGKQIWEIKEQVGYAKDTHAMFILSDDALEFVGFAGDEIDEYDSMLIGEKVWITRDGQSYEMYLDRAHYPYDDIECGEAVLLSEWNENLSFGRNTFDDDVRFISCYWVYKTFLKEMDFINEAERAIIDIGRN